MRIDSHQHFWKYNEVRDTWITDELSKLRRDFLPADLQEMLDLHQIGGCVAVQADQSLEENDFLLGLAKDNAFICGVVGWVDLRSPEVEAQMDFYAQNDLFKGVRHIVQGEKKGFLLDEKFVNGISCLPFYNLTYDILIYPHQLSETIAFVKHFPDQPFVIDHLAKPQISKGLSDDWKRGMKELSQYENVHCKISGMVTETAGFNWQQKDFTPFMDFLLECYGSKRLMYGSDWPVCLVAADYADVFKIVSEYFDGLSLQEKEDIMGNNAISFYGLNVSKSL